MADEGENDAKSAIVQTAKAGAEALKETAREAVGAAAGAAAEVILGHVTRALGSAQEQLQKAAPGIEQQARMVAGEPAQRRAKKRTRKIASATTKNSGPKKTPGRVAKSSAALAKSASAPRTAKKATSTGRKAAKAQSAAPKKASPVKKPGRAGKSALTAKKATAG